MKDGTMLMDVDVGLIWAETHQMIKFTMFIIKCPYCGDRDHSEFSYGGEAHIIRPKQPTELSDNQWAEYLFMRKNTKGLQYERWNHAHGCRRWFNMARDTSNDKIHSVYKMGEKPKK